MKPTTQNIKQNISIAIVGIGCFFPKSAGLKEYWRLIFNGEDGITDVPETHWQAEDYFDKDPKKPDHTYCKRGGFLSPVMFDPTEWTMPPSSLEATDTSQILGLLASKAALEDAGYGEKQRTFNKDKTSVILGVTGTQELVIPLGARLGYPKWRKALEDAQVEPKQADEVIKNISDSYVSWQESSFPGLLGNVVAGRISNRLDLKGTNCVVDAACASSMSAIHLAIMELSTGRSDMVITGGVDALNDIFMHMCFAKTLILSPRGDAKPFSKDADGTVLGEGIGILALKRLEDAEKDGDKIYAVIKGIGTSSDGKSQSIYAPKAEGQVKALDSAYNEAGIDAATVELIEAHGTGTKVGDMVEIEALTEFFSKTSIANAKNKCALGSVKSMIGHTKAAAGAAGLIKTALSLHNKVLPPTLKADKPNPDMNLNESPFYLNSSAMPWLPRKEHPRRAGVSAFGFGGSNFHLVLEEYQKNKREISWDGSVEIFAFSASNYDKLVEIVRSAQNLFDKNSSNKEISKQAAATRNSFSCQDSYRLLLTFEMPIDYSSKKLSAFFTDTLSALETNDSTKSWNDKNIFYGVGNCGKTAFIFPGQGSQYVNMGKDLVCVFPEALEVLECANKQYEKLCGSAQRLSDYIYPISIKEKKFHEEALKNTKISQPAIGIISLLMLKILQRFGVKIDFACGHSFGELTALCAANWIDADTLLHLAISRGSLMASGSKDRGTMLAVKAPLDQLDKLIKDSKIDILLANRNTPNQGVLSGSVEAIAQAETICKQQGFRTIRLPVSAAFHSKLVKDAQEPFMQIVEKINVTPSNIPVFSNTTAKPYPVNSDDAKQLLGEQMICPVDFVNEIKNLFNTGVNTFIEIGPRSVLTNLIKAILKGCDFHAISIDGSAGRQSGIVDLARALCHIASVGATVDLEKWEQTISAPKKQLMSVPISGANYRTPKPKNKKRKTKKTTNKLSDNQDSEGERQTFDVQDKQKNKPQLDLKAEKIIKDSNMDNETENYDNKITTDALKVVQEGLKSMQALQMQTSETHQKFLETQSEASRTLQKMMENIRRITDFSPKSDFNFQTEVFDDSIKPQPSFVEKPMPQKTMEPSVKSYEPKKIESSINENQNEIEKDMLAIVSNLTGYPIEMLDLDMDIETDLGIDSIKRVEILSAVEEKIPNLPTVSPEIMNGLKTLRQIANLYGNAENTHQLKPSESIQINEKQNQISDDMLAIVSKLTGYPIEMLDLDMDIETDLGIDSIKRVEILSAVEEKIPNLPTVSPEIMNGLKTLRQIANLYSGANPSKNSEKPLNFKKFPTEKSNTIDRKIISFIESPLENSEQLSIPDGRKIFVTQGSKLAEAIVDELSSLGVNSELVSINALNEQDSLQAAGLVILYNDNFKQEKNVYLQGVSFLKEAFAATKCVAKNLLDSAQKGGAVFATITRLDGAFGFRNGKINEPVSGGLAGLAKTASLEWKDVHCHAIDVAPNWEDNKNIAKAVAAELLNSETCPVEVGLNQGKRYALKLESMPYDDNDKIDAIFNKGDVVVVSGGAKGITASAINALAKYTSPTIVLLGRSPYPKPEPEWLASLTDEAVIKQAIIKNEFSDNPPSPMQLEKTFKKYIANREIKNNLEKLERHGVKVFYHSVDIRDFDAVNAIFDAVRLSYGSIKGIIHGAGVLEDRNIIDKTMEQFERVFDTKVAGLCALLKATKQDDLKHIVIFSSISGRMGNNGQVDYAMANEVLNKIAQREAKIRPNCKVVSINWGPWDGGMVSPSLKREFERSDIKLIPIEAGAMCMLREMAMDKNQPVEVIVGSSLKSVFSNKQSNKQDKLFLSFKREISAADYPILKSHIIGGKPVVPFALIAEWLGHGALHENPGLCLYGLDDVRLFKGIKLDSEKKTILLMTGKARKNNSIFEVDVEIRDGFKNGKKVIHTRAKALLSNKFMEPPVFDKSKYIDSNYSKDINEIYDKILFHGADLRGIKKIISCSSTVMTALISSAPSPSKWMTQPLRSKWIGDPLALDSAFQMAIVWCFEQQGLVSLPSYSASYRQYRKKFPSEDIMAVLEIKQVSNNKMTGDFTFLDSDDVVIAQLTGYEAVMDASLFEKFKS